MTDIKSSHANCYILQDKNKKTETIKLETGVPQGSFLTPLKITIAYRTSFPEKLLIPNTPPLGFRIPNFDLE